MKSAIDFVMEWHPGCPLLCILNPISCSQTSAFFVLSNAKVLFIYVSFRADGRRDLMGRRELIPWLIWLKAAENQGGEWTAEWQLPACSKVWQSSIPLGVTIKAGNRYNSAEVSVPLNWNVLILGSGMTVETDPVNLLLLSVACV